ncbi:MAG: DsbA family protein [Candidatus Magasanikbacteria bacterium]
MSEDKPFHKTAAGKVFLSLLGIVFLFFLLFGAKVVYYSYQLEYGNQDAKKELVKKFEGGFSSSKKITKKAKGKKLNKRKVQSIIRDYNPKYGSGKQVTIVAFMDFECPFCQKQYSDLKKIMNTYQPAITVVFKHFPLTSIHPHARQAAIASTCAQEQDKFWKFYDKIFERKQFNRSAYLKIARDLSLNIEQFKTCFDKQKYLKRVKKDLADGISVGVKGTPTFIVNNKKIQGVLSKKQWREIILKEIKDE